MEKLGQLLPRLKSHTLNELCVALGAGIGTTKTKRTENILKQCRILHSFKTQYDSKGNLKISSIDSGVANFAISSVVVNPRGTEVVHWGKISLERAFLQGCPLGLSPQETYQLVTQLTDHIAWVTAGTSLYTVERQRTRTGSSRFVTDPVIKVNVLEHLLYFSLKTRGYHVESSDPVKIGKLWVPQEIFSGARSKKYRILRALNLVQNCNSAGNNVQFNERMRKTFTQYNREHAGKRSSLFDALALDQDGVAGTKKDDDLADSLLHALSWDQWFRTYVELYTRMHEGDPSETLLTDFCESRTAQLERLSTLEDPVT
ncbi:cruciform cutting endonuclease KNAG_0H00280 [Huiozyma naganishii CBS 8797]|uniref:Mitochondrial resolvase Ydc2 catalytic domain-containing protein n=1 Tax=Huiozyma naganishii (strain ATCC MYA-139 / BCRC 22969 / CBS 8797 / KCTC 17520 / NBRC 10181 / NCYC 3082 / Yp74L-3) TaxID=1071383 RepID=J7S8A3_HUIN7|nr:hypothetical protein KNAG_0H00280 [Kazachstania naganishii CBS 8797]CCK71444.1 hypothetical protein KNAG_0H00280 [Kazachstania naganishii CBS 8797]